MSLKIEVENRRKGVYAVILDGKLDSHTYLELEEKLKPLLSRSAKVLILDMSRLVYITSSGISAIINAKKAMAERGGELMMINLQPQIKKVFEIVKALPKDTVFESIEEADQYLDAMQKKEIDRQNPTL